MGGFTLSAHPDPAGWTQDLVPPAGLAQITLRDVLVPPSAE